MDEIEYNKQFNKNLAEGIITKEMLNDFDSAYGYAAATSVSWLISKLKILKDVLKDNNAIKIIDNTNVTVLKIEMEFDNWIKDRYKNIDTKII